MERPVKIIKLLDYRNIRKGFKLVNKIIIHKGSFSSIISLKNLFTSWQEFRTGKRGRPDVQLFESELENNIFKLHGELTSGERRKIVYEQFAIQDPKPRTINKAPVADRLLHQAIYRILQPVFDKTFIFDSYSCRIDKGTHRAFRRLVSITRKISRNYTKPCWALKCDIRKFFASIDHEILIQLLEKRIEDEDLMRLLEDIIRSYNHSPGKGMPLGNLTSQLFANVYMDPLDKFVKHKLKVSHYIRYADDFIMMGSDPSDLIGAFLEINLFLRDKLKLKIHPDKIHLRKIRWGIDYVGYVNLPHYNLPRIKTVKRIFKKMEAVKDDDPEDTNPRLQSYLGYLKHVNSAKLSEELILFYLGWRIDKK